MTEAVFQIALSKGAEVFVAIGAHVVLYGATTGRDGIGGASVLASAALDEDDADKRPSVQIGDPFTGKKLIEASLELVEGGLVESLQDCGAAGLASALAEHAAPRHPVVRTGDRARSGIRARLCRPGRLVGAVPSVRLAADRGMQAAGTAGCRTRDGARP